MAAPAPDTLLPTPHDTVIVEGPDSGAFLQGQISQDVLSLAEDAWAWSFVLSPDGKLDVIVRIHRVAAERFELLVDAGFGAALQARLARFKLRTDCAIEVETVPEKVADPAGESARIAAGVPRMGADVEPGDLAASTGLVDAAVDFAKGCFVGQELVARMDSRGGTAPTRLVRLHGEGDAPPVETVVEAGEQPVGRVTSSAPSDSGWIALASVSRKLEGDHATVLGHATAVEEL